jgi:FAD binding domain-containing protein
MERCGGSSPGRHCFLRSVEDVQGAVRSARTYNLSISVRGARHDAAGRAVRPDALVIDLSFMNDAGLTTKAQPFAGRHRSQGYRGRVRAQSHGPPQSLFVRDRAPPAGMLGHEQAAQCGGVRSVCDAVGQRGADACLPSMIRGADPPPERSPHSIVGSPRRQTRPPETGPPAENTPARS